MPAIDAGDARCESLTRTSRPGGLRADATAHSALEMFRQAREPRRLMSAQCLEPRHQVLALGDLGTQLRDGACVSLAIAGVARADLAQRLD